jgi:hypothetical protein
VPRLRLPGVAVVRRRARGFTQPVTLELDDVRLLLWLAKSYEDHSSEEDRAIERTEARILLTYGDPETGRVTASQVVAATKTLYGDEPWARR